MSAFDTQVGGNHYKDMAIQPVEFIQKNRLGFIEGNIVKYICRWRGKNGIDDLRKVRHYIDLLIEMETANLPAKHEEPELTYAEHQEANQPATDAAVKYARDMAELREDKAGAERPSVKGNRIIPIDEIDADLAELMERANVGPFRANEVWEPPMFLKPEAMISLESEHSKPTTRERAAARHLAEMSPSAQKGIEGCEACE